MPVHDHSTPLHTEPAPAPSSKRRLHFIGGLRTRLVVAFVLVALVSAVTATALAYRESRTAVLQRAQDSFQKDFLARIETVVPNVDMPPDTQSLASLATRVSEGLSGAPLVVARYQDLKATSDSLADDSRISPQLRSAVSTLDRTSFQRVEHAGEPYLVVGTPVTYENGQTSGLEVYGVASLRPEQEATTGVLDAVRGGIVPVVLLAALLALLAARTVLRPVRELGRATRRLAEGDLDSRVAVRGGDELADLARDFNHTADELRASVGGLRDQEARARRFVADVSHELRTPLAAMTMVATVLDEDADRLPPDAAHAARTVSAETARLSRLVDDLMEMSRFDSGAAALNAGEIDLGETVRASLALRGWTEAVRLELPEGVRTVADRRRVDVIVANLVGNALRHGAPPVTVAVGAEWDWVTVTVTDSGPGLPPEVLAHVFERFYKADASRTRTRGDGGSGLGTAIALENARLHGGTVEAANRTDGVTGAVFTLRLPHRHHKEELTP
ncbi:two-component sensor histidine kinase [Streptomyces spiroverticillatus]|uniref:histidine kinase n=1 Tax=Streptomyces finlayi TaxID=67296 RepID=A0A918X4S0_9ACTN|nr:HAMP domain-containing sensor histidine kinase [Streptomyces finlayi]GHA34281.1 two-component sensor histidine kinase [Streptomyces spiroverticillatus]GHD11857.1 two-component sensor histidine kinase [Streptomyces finlayi]